MIFREPQKQRNSTMPDRVPHHSVPQDNTICMWIRLGPCRDQVRPVKGVALSDHMHWARWRIPWPITDHIHKTISLQCCSSLTRKQKSPSSTSFRDRGLALTTTWNSLVFNALAARSESSVSPHKDLIKCKPDSGEISSRECSPCDPN